MNLKSTLPVLARVLALITAISGLACSTGSKRILEPTSIDPTKMEQRRNLVFPYGVYKHDINLTMVGAPDSNGKKSERSYHFNGVVRIQDQEIQVVALSPFGTTLFQISENRLNNQVSVDIYLDQMKPFRDKLVIYYATLRQALLLKKSAELKEGSHINLEDHSEIIMGKYDQNGIPEEMTIKGGAFNVDIQVTSYEI